MKFPKEKKRLCPSCRKHTDHKVMVVKASKASSLKSGSKYRARARGRARGLGNQGRWSRPAITKWKMTGKKNTKKTNLKYQCKECKKSHLQPKGIRLRKVELI